MKLSDIILEEMVAFSNDKETRRAAVRKILKDRGLGQVVQMVDSSKVKTVVLMLNSSTESEDSYYAKHVCTS